MNKFAELLAEYIRVDEVDVQDFRDQFAWGHPGIEDRLAFCEFRRAKTAKFLLRTLELLSAEEARPAGRSEG